MKRNTTVTFNIRDIDPKEFSENPINVKKVKQLDGQYAIITSIAIKPMKGDDDDSGYYNIQFGDGSVLLAVSGYHLTDAKK